ncbi:MAG TPA: hypothetical protein VFO90_09045 [Terrimicrobiaceae bacterium]|nr:hypothetical protein [Terrimicrobiaceae bacterium]
MKRLRFRLLPYLRRVFAAAMLSTAAFAQENPAPSPVSEGSDVSARSKALELAGAFSNDGYKIRDGYWPGEIEPTRAQFLEVNLFAGNEYWFSGAVNSPGRKIAVSVLSEEGKPVEYQTYEDGQVAAAGFVPEVSGRYFIKMALLEGDKSQFCLLYSYK